MSHCPVCITVHCAHRALLCTPTSPCSAHLVSTLPPPPFHAFNSYDATSSPSPAVPSELISVYCPHINDNLTSPGSSPVLSLALANARRSVSLPEHVALSTCPPGPSRLEWITRLRMRGFANPAEEGKASCHRGMGTHATDARGPGGLEGGRPGASSLLP